jgi:hypothetical protein
MPAFKSTLAICARHARAQCQEHLSVQWRAILSGAAALRAAAHFTFPHSLLHPRVILVHRSVTGSLRNRFRKAYRAGCNAVRMIVARSQLTYLLCTNNYPRELKVRLDYSLPAVEIIKRNSRESSVYDFESACDYLRNCYYCNTSKNFLASRHFASSLPARSARND